MSYRVKSIRYKNQERRILLQNENGPCPLLAAANALILQGYCTLPHQGAPEASLQDVTNMLAEHAMTKHTGEAFFIDELVQYIPKFQYGMDVNPKFTVGITGYEYTAQLTAFDMMRCKLVHGWLVDVINEEEVFKAVGTKTYNELVENIIQAKEAAMETEQIQAQIQQIQLNQQQQQEQEQPPIGVLQEYAERGLMELQSRLAAVEATVHQATVIQHFLESTSHQLTHYGLIQLHENIQPGELCVLFRNNHFSTLTKHVTDGHLYLLVTDLGYAAAPNIVWERLDVIDGDTEYVNSEFRHASPADQDTDMQLALQLSLQPDRRPQAQSSVPPSAPQVNNNAGGVMDEEARMLAAATEVSLREYNQQQNSSGAPIAETAVELKNPPSSATDSTAPTTISSTPQLQVDTDRLLALQLAQQSISSGGGNMSDEELARQLQNEENQRAAGVTIASHQQQQQQQHQQQQQQQIVGQQRRAGSATTSGSRCVIS